MQYRVGVGRSLTDRFVQSSQSAAHDLERQRATDSLKKGLENRPQREDLIERTPSASYPASFVY